MTFFSIDQYNWICILVKAMVCRDHRSFPVILLYSDYPGEISIAYCPPLSVSMEKINMKPFGLPIDAVLDDVRKALSENAGAVLEALPGAGKTTCIPLALLE
jgi:hypothetical protein